MIDMNTSNVTRSIKDNNKKVTVQITTKSIISILDADSCRLQSIGKFISTSHSIEIFSQECQVKTLGHSALSTE